jgi:hypothetical protein
VAAAQLVASQAEVQRLRKQSTSQLQALQAAEAAAEELVAAQAEVWKTVLFFFSVAFPFSFSFAVAFPFFPVRSVCRFSLNKRCFFSSIKFAAFFVLLNQVEALNAHLTTQARALRAAEEVAAQLTVAQAQFELAESEGAWIERLERMLTHAIAEGGRVAGLEALLDDVSTKVSYLFD